MYGTREIDRRKAIRTILMKFRVLDVTRTNFSHEEMPFLLSLRRAEFLEFQFSRNGTPIPEVIAVNRALGLGTSDPLYNHRDPKRWSVLIWWLTRSEALGAIPLLYLHGGDRPLSRLVEVANAVCP